MKLFLNILKYIASSIVGVLSLVFAFIEIRPLFAGDFLLMESPAASFIGYLFRALFFLVMFINALKVFLCVLFRRELSLAALIFNGVLIVGSVLSFLFYEWFIALILVVLNLLMLIIRLFNKNK